MSKGKHAGPVSVEACRVYKVIATKHAYGWTEGSYILIEVPEADVVTTLDGIEDHEEASIAVMDCARGAIVLSAEERGGLGADGAFAIDLEWAD